MNILKWVSVERLIGRIIRNTGDVSGDYIATLPEWLSEGIFKLKTHYQLELKHEIINVKFFNAELPCNIESIACMLVNGQRITVSSSSANLAARHSNKQYPNTHLTTLKYPSDVTVDVSNPTFIEQTVGYLENVSFATDVRYRVNGGVLELSIETAEVDLWFWTLPVDANKFPLIPDNEDYQTALYWYARMMMVGAGKKDIFDYQYLDFQWNLYARRAVNQITYPSRDETIRTILNTVQLIPTGFNLNSNFETY